LSLTVKVSDRLNCGDFVTMYRFIRQ